MAGVMSRLSDMPRRPDELAPSDFETSAGQQGKETVVAELQADTVLALKQGRNNPIRLAVPAYTSKTLAGDGSQQTFSLSTSITETEVTQDAVVWFAGDYYGTPDSIDYGNDTVTVTGDGSGATVHIFHISDTPATVSIEKVDTGDSNSSNLKTVSAGLVHQTDQSEQPEYFSFPKGEPLAPFVATDMTLEVSVDAPYVTRFEDPDGDEATATNALLALPVIRGEGSVQGLNQEIRDEMA